MKSFSSLLLFSTLALKAASKAIPFIPSLSARHIDIVALRRSVTDNVTFDAVDTIIQSATGQQAIQADINNLTANTLAILNTFNQVGAQLLTIDNEKIANQSFSPQWAAFQQTYLQDLTASRDAASNLSAFCQELSTTIAPFALGVLPGQPPVTPAEAQAILQEILTEAEGLKSTAELVSQSFEDLVTSLDDFTSTFARFADVEQKDNEEIAALQIDIQEMTQTIAKLQTEIDVVAASIGITIFASASLSAFFPEFAPLILGVGAATVAGESAAWGVLQTQLNNVEDQQIQDKAEVVTLQTQLAQIAQANTTLFTISNQTIPALSTQLGAFDAIWDAVDSDITQLIQFVTTANNQAAIAPFLAYSVITTDGSPIYNALATAMLAYASGIQNVGLTLDTMSLPQSAASHAPLTNTAVKIKAMVSAHQAKFA